MHKLLKTVTRYDRGCSVNVYKANIYGQTFKNELRVKPYCCIPLSLRIEEEDWFLLAACIDDIYLQMVHEELIRRKEFEEKILNFIQVILCCIPGLT